MEIPRLLLQQLQMQIELYINDGGTMVQVAVTDLAAYFDDEITAMPNLTSVGTLTTLTVDDITINGSTVSDSGDFTIDGGADRAY